MTDIKKNHGYILITTLLMILILSLLLITRMQELLLYSKMTSRYESYHQNFYQLESLALRLLRKKIDQLSHSCHREMDDANGVLSLLKNKKGCSLNENRNEYQFYIEDLGSDHCLVIVNENTTYSSHHWRYSLVYFKEGTAQSALQLRFIERIERGVCQGEVKAVKQGISSWRYIPGDLIN